MNSDSRKRIRNLVIGALLTALGILIPMIMPAKIVIGPASFTLASHVPVMAAMFFSPYLAALVAVGTTLGFFISVPVPLIWMRAATHIVVMTAGAWFLKKNPDLVDKKVKLQVFNLILGVFHAGLEALVVLAFYRIGFADLNPQALNSLLMLVFFGGIVHSFVDFNLAFGLCKVLNKIYTIDVFKNSKLKSLAE
ncbi:MULTISPECIES: hypothetical protein [Lactococcus]|uniref:Niacin transporter NiaX n=5 Tax=Lactococcus TaxID=1357 RepID=F9VCZ3_LACGL|nr:MULTISPECIES: hypothetical protein [Lactococcus]ETD05236.1 Niacin transporter NiaX [Lactococcus garvieae TRF1]MCA9746453.1 hypothetical protein [Lactococcus sp.]EIT66424.1 Hypothetical protein Y7C_89691 [Lactococcus garvieae IPLA 31405]KAA8714516.1 hypothetical protein F4V47_04120 [Lactococcus garvieae subsp. garvieae]KKF91343.1 membrane protein [Lactococcus garvieae]